VGDRESIFTLLLAALRCNRRQGEILVISANRGILVPRMNERNWRSDRLIANCRHPHPITTFTSAPLPAPSI